jgi:hypothetical protein
MPFGTIAGAITAYLDYGITGTLNLTSTYQKVTNWAEEVTSVNTSYSNGVFTIEKDGVYHIVLSRVYNNTDQNPSAEVRLYIDLRKNAVSFFERDIVIPAATHPSEPASIAFATPFIRELVEGDDIDVYVRGEDGVGVNPQDANLLRMNIALHRIY